ncbi:MAG: histidine triad nucleotide-binding protein [Clostridium sp.]
MVDCLFCKIINGEIPSSKVYEDEWVYAFNDISPVAPVHVLIIPKTHIASANEINSSNEEVLGKIFSAASNIAKNLGISENGYRVVNNCGEDGGQTVHHLHFHLIGGRNLQWPPG